MWNYIAYDYNEQNDAKYFFTKKIILIKHVYKKNYSEWLLCAGKKKWT